MMSVYSRLFLLALFVVLSCAQASATIYVYLNWDSVADGQGFDVTYYAGAYDYGECYPTGGVYVDYFSAHLDGTQCTQAFELTSQQSGSSYSLNPPLTCGSGSIWPSTWVRVDVNARFYWSYCSTYDPSDYTPAGDYRYFFLDGSPHLYSINPNSGEPGESGTMTIQGDYLGFTPLSIWVQSGDCAISFTDDPSSLGRYYASVPYSVDVPSSGSGSSRTCEIRIANAVDSTTDWVGFTTYLYNPAISQISPSSAQRGTSDTLTITGTHFYPGAEPSTDCSGMTLGTLQRQNNGAVFVPYSISAGATPGTCTIQIGNGYGWTAATNNFTITQ